MFSRLYVVRAPGRIFLLGPTSSRFYFHRNNGSMFLEPNALRPQCSNGPIVYSYTILMLCLHKPIFPQYFKGTFLAIIHTMPYSLILMNLLVFFFFFYSCYPKVRNYFLIIYHGQICLKHYAHRTLWPRRPCFAPGQKFYLPIPMFKVHCASVLSISNICFCLDRT